MNIRTNKYTYVHIEEHKVHIAKHTNIHTRKHVMAVQFLQELQVFQYTFPVYIFSHMKNHSAIIDPIYFLKFNINILNLNTTLIATAGCCWLCFITYSSSDVL